MRKKIIIFSHHLIPTVSLFFLSYTFEKKNVKRTRKILITTNFNATELNAAILDGTKKMKHKPTAWHLYA